MRLSSQFLLTSFCHFTNSLRPSRTVSALCRSLLLVASVLLLPAVLLAQNQQYTKNSPDQTMRGDARIDPATHALSIQIPLGTYAGRAGMNIPVSVTYSSKFRHLELDQDFQPYNARPYDLYYEYMVENDERSDAGWTTSLATARYEMDIPPYDGYSGVNVGQAGGTYPYFQGITRMRVMMGDGSTHELRKDDVPRVGADMNFYMSGTYYSVDGSQVRFEFGSGSNTLYLPDGSRYIFPGSSPEASQYIDRNGNTLSYNSTAKQWTDTLGRTFNVLLSSPFFPHGPTDQQYALPGLYGGSLTYTFRWRYLHDPNTNATVLTDPNSELYYPGDSDCTSFQFSPDHFPSVSPALFQSHNLRNPICAHNRYNPVVLSEIVLPNGRSYRFTYNPWGEIDKFYLPTGGYERYQYNQVTPMSYTKAPFQVTNRGVTDRWVSSDGNAASEAHSQYGVEYDGSSGPYVTTVTHPDGTLTKQYLHAHPNIYSWNYPGNQTNGSAPYGFDDARSGRAYEERVYDANGVMLRRTLTEWTVSGATAGGYSGATRDPRVTKQVQIVLDTGTSNALAATITMEYDADLNLIATHHYDYANVDATTAETGDIGSIPNGTLVRTEETTFLVNDPSIDSSTRAAYRARNLVTLPTSARVKDAGENIIAQSMTSYDEEVTFPLLTYGSVTGWNDPGTNVRRGNATTSGSWLNTTGAYLLTHAQYDQLGNLRKTWDARDVNRINPTEIEYSSTYAYAYLTETRTAVPDPSGQTGSSSALGVSNTAFDFNTGLAISSSDANNIPSTLEYNDSLLRPKRTVRAAGNAAQSQSAMEYDDTNRTITGKTDRNAFNDNGLKVKTLYDGLGRTTETQTYESDANYIAVRTEYDAMGRPYKVSNPFRQNETPVWTTTVFDALGRVKSVTTPDGAVVSTDYVGNTVTVTDQAGKKRRSVTDALGRLIRVDEPDANHNLDVSGVPVQSTSYVYDTLDNLITVNQGTQTRTFVYDSLKRLLSATNPESGRICYGTVSTTGECLADGYDANGNLIKKTDARGVVTTYAYDALNRNISVTYTNDPAGTPAINRYYDGYPVGNDGYPVGNSTNIPNVKGRLWQTETSGTTRSRTTVTSYDALGRPLSQSQQFYVSGAFGPAYTVQRTYDLAGHVASQTYPSNRVVNYNYDQAGRLADKDTQNLAFTGNLGDGVTRTYSSGIIYSSLGGMTKEKFGTDTAIYNKLFYNVRGQLAEIRESTSYTGPADEDFDRGAIINFYGSCWGKCGGSNSNTQMTDNNGNLKRQEIYIPGGPSFAQTFAYDSLNRLQSASEDSSWRQEYIYDRYGNRRIDPDPTKTYGVGINNKDFTVNTNNNNRLGVPGGQSGTMHYDPAGNLDIDTYSGSALARTYDAENRMTSETQANSNEVGRYTYNADGQRVRRKVNGVETWQVYGMDGELLAEYAANGSYLSPQKEYGYRNGQLLITAEPSNTPVNVALASNGATASASSAYAGWAASSTINGDRKGMNGGQDGGWVTAQAGFPASLEVDFSGSQSINEIDVFTLQDNWTAPVEPTAAMTFATYGLTGYEVQYWNGSAWVTVTNGSITGNNKVWKKFSFSTLSTTKIRVLANASADGYSRLTEVEAWTAVPPPPRYDVALGSNGATASASSIYGTGYAASAVINGDRKGLNAGSNGNWNDAPPANTFPDWVQVDFSGSKTIDEIDVFTLQDNWAGPSEPTETMTFSQWGLTGFDVQYWNGSAWVTVPGGSISGNNKIWQKITFAPITTTKIRVLTHASVDGYSRLTEVEAYGSGAVSAASNINWLITDQLGTPRLIFDKTGSTTKRHDYLPFGEELFATQGARTTSLGYPTLGSSGDGVRQEFTLKERDNETGLDYFLARYYSSTQGRFTSIDPENAGADVSDPQSWNGYSYTRNTPTGLVDPDGRAFTICYSNGDCHNYSDKEFDRLKADATQLGSVFKNGKIYNDVDGNIVATASYRRTSADDLNDFANGVIFGRGNSAGLVERAPVAGKLAFITAGVGAAIGVTGGAIVYAAPALLAGATETALGITSKAAARGAIERMAVSQAAKAAAKSAVSRATTASTIDIVRKGGTLVVSITRAGRDGYQVIESVIKSDGTKAVVQKAFDAAGKLVHYDPK